MTISCLLPRLPHLDSPIWVDPRLSPSFDPFFYEDDTKQQQPMQSPATEKNTKMNKKIVAFNPRCKKSRKSYTVQTQSQATSSQNNQNTSSKVSEVNSEIQTKKKVWWGDQPQPQQQEQEKLQSAKKTKKTQLQASTDKIANKSRSRKGGEDIASEEPKSSAKNAPKRSAGPIEDHVPSPKKRKIQLEEEAKSTESIQKQRGYNTNQRPSVIQSSSNNLGEHTLKVGSALAIPQLLKLPPPFYTAHSANSTSNAKDIGLTSHGLSAINTSMQSANFASDKANGTEQLQRIHLKAPLHTSKENRAPQSRLLSTKSDLKSDTDKLTCDLQNKPRSGIPRFSARSKEAAESGISTTVPVVVPVINKAEALLHSQEARPRTRYAKFPPDTLTRTGTAKPPHRTLSPARRMFQT